MAKVLFVVAQKNFRDEELFHTREELERAGHSCAVASLAKGEAAGVMGRKTSVDYSVGQVHASGFDCVVFVGGQGVEQSKLYENKEILSLARGFASAGKIVSAICIAPRILARAGVVERRKTTFFPDGATRAMLEEAGAICVADDVMVDGKMITANGPGAARRFGQELARALKRL